MWRDVSIPFIAGQWSLLGSVISGTTLDIWVSIPFIAGQWSLHGSDFCRRVGGDHVSIPFIAGQWSLRPNLTCGRSPSASFQSPSLRGSGRFDLHDLIWRCDAPRFNPLHCGAVVASRGAGRRLRARRMFQSPSLRGSGRFGGSRRGGRARTPSFNPLHCGAVVASSRPRCGATARRGGFQSPSLRGSGRFIAALAAWREAAAVSIPFIAGQWSLLGASAPRPRAPVLFQSPSLRGSGRFNKRKGGSCGTQCQFQSPSLRGSGRFGRKRNGRMRKQQRFNPLHCGAVVASRLADSMADMKASGFNPLHCGAVVASYDEVEQADTGDGCFNPLHCGAVVASVGQDLAESRVNVFQSPSLRGSGRFRHWAPCRMAGGRVSIPFIAGQWSLPSVSSSTS